jgi:hypothetical protein
MEIATAGQNHTVVCDRAALDNYAYLVAATGGHPVLDELVSHWMKTYDYLFKVPITFELEKDGTRDIDLKFQREIDGLVDRLLQEKHLVYYRLPSRNRTTWMTYIQRIMELPKARPKARSPAQSPQQMSLPIKGE